MAEAAQGFMSKTVRYPARGERIAAWVEAYMRAEGLGIGELAMRAKADKRDLQRLLRERSCGPRLNDALEEAFQWDFIEQVATPVVGADPVTTRERELERRLAEAAALHARVEREHALRKGHAAAQGGHLALVGEDRVFNPKLGGGA